MFHFFFYVSWFTRLTRPHLKPLRADLPTSGARSPTRGCLHPHRRRRGAPQVEGHSCVGIQPLALARLRSTALAAVLSAPSRAPRPAAVLPCARPRGGTESRAGVGSAVTPRYLAARVLCSLTRQPAAIRSARAPPTPPCWRLPVRARLVANRFDLAVLPTDSARGALC